VSDRQPKQNIDTAFVVLVCCGFYGTRLEIAFHPLRQSHHGTTQPSCEVEYGEQNGRWAVLLHRVPGHILSLVNTVACRVRWIRCDPARLRFDASCGQLEAYIIHHFRSTSFPVLPLPRDRLRDGCPFRANLPTSLESASPVSVTLLNPTPRLD
jgi:hypothetical protein